MNEKQLLTAERVQAEYQKGVQFNTYLDLYDDVKQCENFVEGKQWEGLKSKHLRPITMNVLDPIVHYKVAQIVSNDVDLILANATPALQAAAAGTDTIPILGTAVTEYGVALGLDDFNGTVGGNISGTSDLAPLDQQAAMLQELFPDAKNVGLLYCSAEPNSQYQVDTVKAALEDLGYTCEYYAFSDSNDLSSVVTTAVSESDVIYVPTDNTVASNTEIINNICLPEQVPVIAGEEGICDGCGVATLSINYYDLGYATGEMAVRILADGEDISAMPIEYAPKFTKEYNAEICEQLGVTVPDDYVAIGASDAEAQTEAVTE